MNDTKAIQRTPGPWSVDSIDQVHAKDGTVVARCERKERHEYMSCEVQRANARLIAAAPDLLEALKVIAQECQMRGFDLTDGAVLLASAAIAKAEGR